MEPSSLYLEQFRQIRDDLRDLRDDGSERGRRLWAAIDAQNQQIADLAHRMGGVEKAVMEEAETLKKYRTIEQQAIGAGRLGRVLLVFGGGLMSLAAAIYTAWDGIVAFVIRFAGR